VRWDHPARAAPGGGVRCWASRCRNSCQRRRLGERVGRRGGKDGFGHAKSVILLYLQGGPSHIDIWDPKPDAPSM